MSAYHFPLRGKATRSAGQPEEEVTKHQNPYQVLRGVLIIDGVSGWFKGAKFKNSKKPVDLKITIRHKIDHVKEKIELRKSRE